MRTIFWDSGQDQVHLIDQRLLPGELRYLALREYAQIANAIRQMAIRGAPAIGAAAAFGLALAARQSNANTREALLQDLRQAAGVLRQSRPTAVNLGWALQRTIKAAEQTEGGADALRAYVLDEALRIAEEDVAINKRMAEHGAALINDGDTVIHHCNTGSLAAVDWGTALGVLRMAHEQGKRIHVLVDETRPRLQGARLTAWELEQYGMSYAIISDGAAGYFLSTGQAQKVIFGADRVAANGDVANKIGTYMLALAANDNQAPAYAVVPTSTIDLSLADGKLIPIEEREPDEVLCIQVQGQAITPAGAAARNPAFDVTPHRLVTAIVTENGVARPPYTNSLRAAVAGQQVG